MSGINFLVLDCETLGLSSRLHDTVEVSIIRCSDRTQLTEFIKAERIENVSIDALRIQNKTLEDLQYGKSKEEVVEKIDKFLNEDGLTPAHRCIICHNANFDRRFMHALYERVNKIFPANLWVCSMEMSRHYGKKVLGVPKPKVNLAAAMELVGIKKLAGAHASKVDSRNTYLLWKDLIENKKIDYLPFIKTAPHILAEQDQGLDPDLLDLE